jgi:hypothetical protein
MTRLDPQDHLILVPTHPIHFHKLGLGFQDILGAFHLGL